MAFCGLSLHLGSSEGCKTPQQNYLSNRHSYAPWYQWMLFIQLIYSCFLVTMFSPTAKLHFLHENTHTTHNSYNFSDERLLHLKCQLLNSTQWPIYIINSVNNTKLPCYTLPLMQHQNFFRNLPPLPAQQSSTEHELTEKNNSSVLFSFSE